MQPRTRKLLIGATLALLAVMVAAAFGVATASAAAKTKIHKISSCGTTITKAGTYELTTNVTNSGSGTDCITLYGDNITLYLDGHTITGDGSTDEACVYIEGGGTAENVNESVYGGTVKKPSTMATLTGCYFGVYNYYTSNAVINSLKIKTPVDSGVYAYYAGGMMASNINVTIPSGNVYGFYIDYGGGNTVTKSTVDNNGPYYAFYTYYELGDTFSYDSVKDSYSSAGCDGTGFYDEESSNDVYTHNSSKGQADGFYFYEDYSGVVTATHNYAAAPSALNGEGFYVYDAFTEGDSQSPFHTVISHNKTNGFAYGFEDYMDATEYYPVAEKYIDNTANNYSEYGFYFYYLTDYTITGNIADANTAGHKYDGTSSNYGFYLTYPEAYYPPAAFNNNQAYDNEYGMYSDAYMVGGKDNIAKRNKYNGYDVQITG